MVYVLDTHAVVWFLEGSSRLGAAAKIAMNDPTADLVVPTIVLVEAGFLYAKKRSTVDVDAVQQKLIAAANCIAYPPARRRTSGLADPNLFEHSRRDHCSHCAGLQRHPEASGRDSYEGRRDLILRSC
jgi:PIN domain